MIGKLGKSDFVKSVAVLLTGTLIAQIIAYVVYSLVARAYYSAEDLAEFGIYTRVSGFVAAIATARYEQSLPIARQDLHAFYLYRLSFRIALVVLTATGIIGLVYFLLKPFDPGNFAFLVMTVASTYFAVWINLGTNWSIRKKAFSRISRQRVINSLVTNGLRWLFAVFSWGGLGIIFATLIGSFVSGLVFIREYFNIRRFYSGYAAPKRLRVLSREYKQFPLVNLPHVLLDLGVDVIVALLITDLFGEKEFGFYSHSYAMVRLPLAIVGQSIGQVFYNKCSEMVNKGQSVLPLLLKTYKTLFLLAIIPFTLLFFYGEELFTFAFKEKFRESGRLSEIMAPWLMLNFILSPVSGIPLIFGRQRPAFIIGIISAAGQLVIYGVLPFVLPKEWVTMTSFLYATSAYQSVLLLINFFLYIRFVKEGRRNRV